MKEKELTTTNIKSILDHVQKHGSINQSAIQSLLSCTVYKAGKAAKAAGLVRDESVKGVVYNLPKDTKSALLPPNSPIAVTSPKAQPSAMTAPKSLPPNQPPSLQPAATAPQPTPHGGAMQAPSSSPSQSQTVVAASMSNNGFPHFLTWAQIQVDSTIQQREKGVDPATVDEYAELMLEGTEFPPVVVFFDGKKYWLADGFTRDAAGRKAQKKGLNAEVRPGGRREALLYATGANAAHGLRRTNADKRRSVRTLLTLILTEKWTGWSDHKVAIHCGVSQPFVSQINKELKAGDNGYQSDQGDTTKYSASAGADTTKIVAQKKTYAPTPSQFAAGKPKPAAEGTKAIDSTTTADTGTKIHSLDAQAHPNTHTTDGDEDDFDEDELDDEIEEELLEEEFEDEDDDDHGDEALSALAHPMKGKVAASPAETAPEGHAEHKGQKPFVEIKAALVLINDDSHAAHTNETLHELAPTKPGTVHEFAELALRAAKRSVAYYQQFKPAGAPDAALMVGK